MRIALFAALSLAAPAAAAPQQATAARIDHVALLVRDLDTSAAFYQRLFGLREIAVPVDNRRWFDLGGGVALHLIPEMTTPIADQRGRHLALAVTGFPGFVERLAREGIAFTDFAGKPGTVQAIRRDGVRQVFLRDPDGNWIEVNDADPQPRSN